MNSVEKQARKLMKTSGYNFAATIGKVLKTKSTAKAKIALIEELFKSNEQYEKIDEKSAGTFPVRG